MERRRYIGHGVDRAGPDIFPGDQAAGGAPRRLELSGGIRNQVEGGFIQSLSWTSREVVRFDATRRTSFDWSSYPILRFSDVPWAIEVHIINRSGSPFLGTGESRPRPRRCRARQCAGRCNGHSPMRSALEPASSESRDRSDLEVSVDLE